jgi:hypothetical protein
MARSRLCRVCKDFHPLGGTWPVECYGHFGVQASPAPFVRADGMDPLRSMVSGQFFDSKSAYYAEVRRAGCEIVGDDKSGFRAPPGYQPGNVEADIKRTIMELSRAG